MCDENKCVENIRHARVKVEEFGKKAIFLNPEKNLYKKGRIDKCLIKEGVRADFLSLARENLFLWN
ncbi:hypothetical protein GCM10027082_40690 [Comamonas humi]